MARNFTQGTTGRVALPFAGDSSSRTWAIRLKTGNQTAIRKIFSKRGDAGSTSTTPEYLELTATNVTSFNREFTTTGGEWTTPAFSEAVWHNLVITHTGSTTAPLVYLDGASQTVTTVSAPVGTLVTNGLYFSLGPALVGNTNGADMDVAEFAVWDRILSTAEITAWSGGLTANYLPQSLVLGAEFADTTIMFAGAEPTSVTGTTVTAHPPTKFRPRAFIWQPPPAASATLEPLTGHISVVGYPPSISRTMVPLTGHVPVVGKTPSVVRSINPAVAQIDLQGYVPSLPVYVSAQVGHVSVTGKLATLVGALAPAAGHVTGTGYQPSIVSDVYPQVGHIAVVGKDPSISTVFPLTGARHFADGTSDRVAFPFAGNSTSRTWALRIRTGDQPGIRTVFAKRGEDGGAPGSPSYLELSATNAVRFTRGFSTTSGLWTCPAFSEAVWHTLIITHDGSATTNAPVIYVDGVSQSVTLTTAPVGTIETNGLGFNVGTSTASTSVAAIMDVAAFAIWDRILSQVEVNALSGGLTANYLPQSLVLGALLASTTVMLVGAPPTSITGTTLTDAPPTKFKPRAFIWQPPPLGDLPPVTGHVTTTGYQPSIARTIAPLIGHASVTGGLATLARARTPTVGHVTGAGYLPAVARSINPATGQVSVVGKTPSISASDDVDPLTGHVSIVGNTPALARACHPAVGHLGLQGYVAGISTSDEVDPQTGRVSVVGGLAKLTGSLQLSTSHCLTRGHIPIISGASRVLPGLYTTVIRYSPF